MNLSQEEISALLGGGQADDEDESSQVESVSEIEGEAAVEEAPPAANGDLSTVESLHMDTAGPEYSLNPQENDTLGEVGNICMGAVATTMYTLLDRRVSITTPRVSVHTTKQVLAAYQVPFVVVEVEYVEGITGKNLLVLKEYDAALITDLLMGGEGIVEEPIELNELHMSAINEIMNQMIGASATAMSKLLEMPVNISTPISNRVDYTTDVGDRLDHSDVVVKISFDMEIEGLLKSQLLQLIPYDLGRKMAKDLAGAVGMAPLEDPAAAVAAAPAVEAPEPVAAPPAAAPPVPAPAPAAPPPAPAPMPGSLVDVRPIQYTAFDGQQAPPPGEGGMNLVHDIPLQVSVELGKTRRQISDILDFGMGTVVVLDKLAGDPVEILVNGKLIARGEVVVIDENYGVRITEIIA